MTQSGATCAKGHRSSPLLGTTDRYLLKRFFAPFLFIEVAVILFFELERALRLLFELSSAGADLDYFFPLLFALTPYYVSFALPVAFFLALMMLMVRLDDDQELQAMLAIGMPLWRIARPLVAAGILVSALAMLTNGWLEPLGRHQFRNLRVAAIASGNIAHLTAGAFYSPDDSLMVLTTPQDDQRQYRVLVWQRDEAYGQWLITARDAGLRLLPESEAIQIEFVAGSVLASNQRTGIRGKKGRLHRLTFDRLALTVPLASAAALDSRERDERELTLPELLEPGEERLAALGQNAIAAELWGRVGKAALIPLLPFLVLPLVMAGRHGNRLPGGVIAAGLFILAQQVLNMARQRAAFGLLDALPSIALVVGLFTVLQLVLIVAGRNLPSHSPLSLVIEFLGRVIARLQPKERVARGGAWLPHGTMLCAYLARRVMAWTLIVLVLLLALGSTAEILLAGSAFVEHGMSGFDQMRYAALRAPFHALQAIPVAALLGPVLAFYLLIRRRELLTVALIGVSQWRIFLMVLPVPLTLGFATYGLDEYLVPKAEQVFSPWWQASAPTAADDLGQNQLARWFAVGNNLVRVGGISPEGTSIDSVLIVNRDEAGAVTELVTASGARITGSSWMLEDVVRQRIMVADDAQEDLLEEKWEAGIDSVDMRTLATRGTAFSSDFARRALTGEGPASHGEAAYLVRIWRGYSLPLLPILMMLFALPVVTVSHQGKACGLAIAWATVMGASFLIADGLLTLMAVMGKVSVVTGVWAVPMFFLAVALVFVMRDNYSWRKW